jgi:hypothetical protein
VYTIGGEKEVRVVVGGAPFDFVDLLFDFKTLQASSAAHDEELNH